MDLQTVAPKDLQVCGYGNINVTIHRAAKERAALLFNPDNAHRQAAHTSTSFRSDPVWEKLLSNVGAQNHDKRRACTSSSEIKRPNSMVLSSISTMLALAEDLCAGKLDAVLF